MRRWLVWGGFFRRCLAGPGWAPRRLLGIDAPVLEELSVVLSTGVAAPMAWSYFEVKYSLTVPQEALAVAVLCVVRQGYAVLLRLHRPEDEFSETLVSGKPSAFADVPSEEAAHLVLEVQYGSRSTNYTIVVIRSTITSDFQFQYPDPAATVQAEATLTGLVAVDGFGDPLRMEPMYFDPRRSQYLVFANPNTGGGYEWTRAVASKNDPAALLHLRVDGSDWEDLESGILTRYISVPVNTWLLLEVRVTSATATAGTVPLVYQLLISRELRCHVLCRTCFGPEAIHCLSCRTPLVLNNGTCKETACPPSSYYEWTSFQCRPCDESCAQCSGPGASACTQCRPLFFLSPLTWEDLQAPCVLRCPGGTFAHPRSRRCRKPPSAPVKTFYLQFKFRSTFQDFSRDPIIQESVLNTTAFVLGLALSDIRGYKMEAVEEEYGIVVDNGPPLLSVEVVSPFLSKDEADHISMNTWFGAFEVPVDEVQSFTWDQMHPPLPPLPVDPFLPTWAWGLGTSASAAILLLFPIYCCYFRRLANTRRKYRPAAGVDPTFMERVVHNSDSQLVKRFVARDSGAQLMRDAD
ncbi:Pcsk5 [Symbiodinium sp. CCMP2592]|nr:Pcsk5 [Symbiodinium sp. CCMP2592]